MRQVGSLWVISWEEKGVPRRKLFFSAGDANAALIDIQKEHPEASIDEQPIYTTQD